MAVVDQDRGGKSGAGSLGPRGRKIFDFILYGFIFLVLAYYFGNLHFYRTVDCTVVSAEVVSGGGGLRSSSSWQGVNTETEECGLVFFTKMQNEGFDSAQDLADELNRHRGERLRFRVSYLYVGHYTARAVELEGFPIRG
ncbi:hypothetical protein [Rothia sp. CCM 9416]|uniref:hypothetical protein n=1 Tax=Rothia sp. CCM 9416 TaxID=3402655 RepID=UPI003AE9CD39